jgi:RNA polymerase sigma-70 factor (ECF subfamily)
MDEGELIKSAQMGDLDSYNRLVLAYQDVVFTQAYRMMGELSAAEDAAQEAFISAYKNIRSFRGGSFKAWLLRIVTNACYDEFRRQKRQPTTPLEPLNVEKDDEIESPAWLVDYGESPEEYIQRKEIEQAIQHCLDRLPLEFKSVVILVEIQGLNYGEASQTIGKPIGTVKSRLCRARIRLRECLQGFWELLPARFRLENEAMR